MLLELYCLNQSELSLYLRATESFKLVLQLVLHEDGENAEESEHHQQQHSLHSDGVHGGGELLKSCASLQYFF